MTRRGFTLIETLVVIAIIAVLLGLLIPAVMRVRDASLSTVCSNNLRQIGLAHHQYHNQHGLLPPGMRSEASNDPYPFMAWHARLLPFLEQPDLWNSITAIFAKHRNFLHRRHREFSKNRLPMFLCPADARDSTSKPSYMGLTSYQGVSGLDFASRDGCLFTDSTINFSDISDGLSNTLLVGERPSSPELRFGWWYAGWGLGKTGAADMILGVRERHEPSTYPECEPGPYSYKPPRNNTDKCATFHYWSFHIGGGHFLMADAAVHFLTYSAAPRLPALASRAGGEGEPVP